MRQAGIAVLVLSLCFAAGAAYTQEHPIAPLLGSARQYTVQRGDTPYKIARRAGINRFDLARLNNIRSGRLKPGTKLTLPTLFIPPMTPKTGIVLNVPERQVYVFKKGAISAHYPVAVGKPDWQTALGTFRLREKKENPQWQPTEHIAESENIKDDPVPAGKENPLGDRWMGWSAPGYGFHSTNAPRFVGGVVSHGCVRLYPEGAHSMFDEVSVGMPIYSVYEPVRVGARGGKFYLVVNADIYHKKLVSVARVENLLKKDGLFPVVNTKKIAAIVKQQDGYPHPIAGSDDKVTVNGAEVKTPLAPMQAAGHWMVPAKVVVAALGGKVIGGKQGEREIQGAGHSLKITVGQRHALLDGKMILLPVEPTVVEDTLIVPANALTGLFGAQVVESKNHTLDFTTTTANKAQPGI